MANLKELLQSVTENFTIEEEVLNNFMEAIPDVELPESFKDEFHKQWLTPTAAKNNSDIMAHYKGKYLSSADLKLKKGLLGLGFTEDDWNAFKDEEPDTLKLVDLAFDKIKARKSTETTNTKGDNKEFEAYKKQTIKQIEELKAEIESKDSVFESKIGEVNNSWRGKLKDAKFNELLSGKKFDSTLPEEDVRMLIRSKINNSDYDIRMSDDLTFKIYDKANPEMEAIKDGKNVTITDVLDEFASAYTKKNDQPTPAQPRAVQVEVPANNSGDVDGRFIPGHPDYGKK